MADSFFSGEHQQRHDWWPNKSNASSPSYFFKVAMFQKSITGLLSTGSRSAQVIFGLSSFELSTSMKSEVNYLLLKPRGKSMKNHPEGEVV